MYIQGSPRNAHLNLLLSLSLELGARELKHQPAQGASENKNPHTGVLSMLLLTHPPTFIFIFVFNNSNKEA
jgi:hypothetical protein